MGQRDILPAALIVGALACTGPAAAQSNLEKLSSFRTTGTPLDIQTVAQTGPKAEAIKRNLQRIKLPPGLYVTFTGAGGWLPAAPSRPQTFTPVYLSQIYRNITSGLRCFWAMSR